MSEVKFKLAAGTNVGLIRQNNEDNFIVCSDLSTSEWLIPQAGDYADLGPYGALLVVADGMGGANAGEVASAIAVETIQQTFIPNRLDGVIGDEKSIQEFMKDAVKSADMNILTRSQEDPSTQGMGTTIVIAWILGSRAYVCWCGDSRCYVLSRQHGLVQLSKDHSYVQELVDKGELSAELMHDHPLSNVITRCLGDSENRARPETRVYELHDGDTIMLCSDGLCGLCHDDHIEEVMRQFREDPMECKNELISAALSCGGYDNVTIALCNVEKPSEQITMTTSIDAAIQGAETVSEEKAEDIEDETEKKGEGEEKDSEEEEEELSNTIRNEATARKRHFWRNLLFVLLFVLIAASVYIYFAPDCEHLRQEILTTLNQLYNGIKK
ncbi:MAG: protein phosphatase 2C domain-containing protein [Prevotella sp.]|nr:protein phosphatase 2C domain-containing protein [Prevotella sp.]